MGVTAIVGVSVKVAVAPGVKLAVGRGVGVTLAGGTAVCVAAGVADRLMVLVATAVGNAAVQLLIIPTSKVNPAPERHSREGNNQRKGFIKDFSTVS